MNFYIFINQYASTPEEGFGGRYYYFSKALQENGNKVLLVSSANHHLLRNKPKFKGLWQFKNHDGLEVLWLKTLPYSKASSPIRVLNWFLFSLYLPFLVFLKIKPQQVHYSSPSPIGFIGAWLLSRLVKAKSVFDVRDVWPSTLVEIGGISPRNLFVRMLYGIEYFCLKYSDVVTSNLANMDLRLKELNIDTCKFFWFSNGVDQKGVENSLLNSTLSLPQECSGKTVIGYTGTLGEANSLYTMLNVAKMLENREELIFIIVGDGKERVALLDFCVSNNINNVIFMNSVAKNDIYKLQSQMDILCVGAKDCSLYRYGVSPNKLYEYIYSGVPVVYYINTPNYHPVLDAKCGREVSPSDTREFAQAVLELIDLTDEDKKNIDKSAKDYIRKNHMYKNLALNLVIAVDNHD